MEIVALQRTFGLLGRTITVGIASTGTPLIELEHLPPPPSSGAPSGVNVDTSTTDRLSGSDLRQWQAALIEAMAYMEHLEHQMPNIVDTEEKSTRDPYAC